MTTYQPQQRKITVQMLTPVGWVAGSLHLPTRSLLLDYLNHAREFVPVTAVSFEMQQEAIPFFALRRDSIMVLCAVGEDSTPFATSTEETTPTEISCLMERGTLYGTMHIRKGVRTFDYFAHQSGFVVLENCEMLLSDRWGQAVTEIRRNHVLVNSKFIIGVSDAGKS